VLIQPNMYAAFDCTQAVSVFSNRLRSLALIGLAAVAAGCASNSATGGDAAGSGGQSGSDGTGTGGTGGDAACTCTKSTNSPATFSASWECFCAAAPSECMGDIATPWTGGTPTQTCEHAACGLTVVRDCFEFSGLVKAFETETGKIVGLEYFVDTATLMCPIDKSAALGSGNAFRTGRFPPADCPATSCSPNIGGGINGCSGQGTGGATQP
jgi:hypothetical protein